MKKKNAEKNNINKQNRDKELKIEKDQEKVNTAILYLLDDNK